MIIVVDSVGIRSDEDRQQLLQQLDALAGHRLIVLTRGLGHDWPPHQSVPFPSYEWDRCNAADSRLIEQFCRHYAADLLISTAWTTPLATRTVLAPSRSLMPPEDGREASELKLGLAYCHAVIAEGAIAARWETLLARHSSDRPIVADIGTAVTMPGRSDDFYREWGRLRLVQDAVDTKVWSHRRGPEYGACGMPPAVDDGDEATGADASWEEREMMQGGSLPVSGASAASALPGAPLEETLVVRTPTEEELDPVNLLKQVRRLQLETDDLRLDRNRHRAAAAHFQRELSRALQDLETVRAMIEIAERARDDIVVLAREFDDRLAREVARMEDRSRIDREALAQRLEAENADAVRHEVVSLATEIEAKLVRARTMALAEAAESQCVATTSN